MSDWFGWQEQICKILWKHYKVILNCAVTKCYINLLPEAKTLWSSKSKLANHSPKSSTLFCVTISLVLHQCCVFPSVKWSDLFPFFLVTTASMLWSMIFNVKWANGELDFRCKYLKITENKSVTRKSDWSIFTQALLLIHPHTIYIKWNFCLFLTSQER